MKTNMKRALAAFFVFLQIFTCLLFIFVYVYQDDLLCLGIAMFIAISFHRDIVEWIDSRKVPPISG